MSETVEKQIEHLVDRLLSCPKSQEDALIRKLKALQKQRVPSAGRKRGFSTPTGCATGVDEVPDSMEETPYEQEQQTEAGPSDHAEAASSSDQNLEDGGGSESTGLSDSGGSSGRGLDPTEDHPGYDAGPDR